MTLFTFFTPVEPFVSVNLTQSKDSARLQLRFWLIILSFLCLRDAFILFWAENAHLQAQYLHISIQL